MTEVVARRTLEEPATERAVDTLHDLLDDLWVDASFVPVLDRMAFTTAVIEAASNVVQHGEPADGGPLRLGVELSVEHGRMKAVINEIGAAPLKEPPLPLERYTETGQMEQALTENYEESGRGLSMIWALVSTVTVERQGTTNVWILSRDSPRDA